MQKYLNIKSIFIILILSMSSIISQAQNNRLKQLKLKLENIAVDSPGLLETVDINVNNIILPDFLRAIAKSHSVNLNISTDLNSLVVSNNFTNSSVIDILLFICEEYNLTIDFIGNILSIKKYTIPNTIKKARKIPISYENELFSIDLQKDTLFIAFKKITDKTGKNLIFEPGLENLTISSYIKKMPFDSALDKIAFANNLKVTKTRDNYYLFENNNLSPPVNVNKLKKKFTPNKRALTNYYFKVIDSIHKIIDVDFENVEIASIISDLGYQLNINMFTSSPLIEAGTTTVKGTKIAFDLLLNKILENTTFTYKKQDSIYYFGKKESSLLQNTVTIPLLHRSIEIMNNDSHKNQRNTPKTFTNYSNNSNTNNYLNKNYGTNNGQHINTNNSTSFSSYNNKTEALVNILPKEIIKDLDIKIDTELNSFIVSGPSQNIQKFRKFIKYIDKPIPVITIEVMILEVNKTATVETGMSWGLGDINSTSSGNTFPTTDMTIGANDINKIIRSNNGFGALNIGKVLPNFYLNIKAMESNGDIKVRSTPKLSTLNGHRSSLSIGETTYYVVTDRNYYGSQIPQISEIKNYQPIDAQLGIDLKPLVSGDGQITMEINVIQSSFNNTKVDENAPPGINSRQFTSIVRVKDQELIVLGGLEEKVKNDSGSGVPLLARIPVLKWFFSTRKREDSKKKLVILIKPTVIY